MNLHPSTISFIHDTNEVVQYYTDKFFRKMAGETDRVSITTWVDGITQLTNDERTLILEAIFVRLAS